MWLGNWKIAFSQLGKCKDLWFVWRTLGGGVERRKHGEIETLLATW